jgi:hypothetical protein
MDLVAILKTQQPILMPWWPGILHTKKRWYLFIVCLFCGSIFQVLCKIYKKKTKNFNFAYYYFL